MDLQSIVTPLIALLVIGVLVARQLRWRDFDPARVLVVRDRRVGGVDPHRRADRPGQPVPGQQRADLVPGEAALDVAVAVAPGPQLLDDPGGQPGR